MKNTQRVIYAVFLSLTVLMLLFNVVYTDDVPSRYVTFGVRFIMVVTVLALKKPYREQKLIALAFVFTAISDFNFVFVNTFETVPANSPLFGLLGFLGAYACLIATFHRKPQYSRKELFVLLPFVLAFMSLIVVLRQYASGFMLIAAMILGVILCVTAATMTAALFRGYFSRSAALLIAAAGILMFLGDILVAFTLFHPDFDQFILWKDNLIVITYVPAWILLLDLASREDIYSEEFRMAQEPTGELINQATK